MESQIEKALYKWRQKEDELLLDIDKPLVALYIALDWMASAPISYAKYAHKS